MTKTQTEEMLSCVVVDFRTRPNGAYKYMRGLTRGYWRLLRVRDPLGSRRARSSNVLAILADGCEGIRGVTSRSRYDIDYTRRVFSARADQINAESAAEWIRLTHHAE